MRGARRTDEHLTPPHIDMAASEDAVREDARVLARSDDVATGPISTVWAGVPLFVAACPVPSLIKRLRAEKRTLVDADGCPIRQHSTFHR